MKICYKWGYIKYIEAICPYCHVIDTYCKPGLHEGAVVLCVKCNKRFKLGK